MSPSLLVERFGSHVNAVWPRDRAGLWIDTDLGEIAWVSEWLENAGPLVR
jgi:hypothetical protein